MTMLLSSAVALLGLTGTVSVATAFQGAGAESVADELSLFDGATLAGWSGDMSYWSVEDGAIVGRSTADHPCDRTTYLAYTGAEFGDFDLTLEYRIDGGNSGVQFRSVVQGPHRVSGYQADLEDGPNWTGGVYEQDGRGVLCRRSVRLHANGPNTAYDLLGDPDVLGRLGGPRAWHTYRIRCVGPRIQLFVDGTLTAELDDRDPAARSAGSIALQLHAGPAMEIRYRNLRLTPIESKANAGPEWIWAAGEPAAGQLARFERTVKARGPLERVTLWGTADNGVEFSLDDRVFAAGEDWSAPFEVELSQKLTKRLGDGKPHRLGAECWNDGGPAGLVARLTLEYADGTSDTVETNRWWRVSTAAGPAPATVLGPLGMEPWGTPTGTSSGSPDLTLPASKIELPPGFIAEDLLRVPRSYGSWASLAVDAKGRILAGAENQNGLFRITLDGPGGVEVEPLDLAITAAQGLEVVGDDLYIVQNQWKGQANGLYRARDTDGGDRFDELTLLTPFEGSGEHGPHAVRLTPDGLHLQVIAGNSTKVPELIETPRVLPYWYEDQLLPSLPDTFGHGNTMHLHGGWTAQCDLNGENWDLLAAGMRNAYDFAYDRAGNAFTYDSDMEWDMGLPWYRAPRVIHLAPGLEFGWRRGSGKIDAAEPDTFGAICETGPASPVGVVHGKDGGFHPPFNDQLFVGDWTRGILYAVSMDATPDGFKGRATPFLTGRPLPITDMTWLPDGSLVVATGGRGRKSALYRIRSTVDARASDGPGASTESQPESQPEAQLWAPDGTLGTRLRLAAAERGESPTPSVGADATQLLAMARIGTKDGMTSVWNRLASASRPVDAHWLRTLELLLARHGLKGSSQVSDIILRRVENAGPFEDERLNVKLTELLVYLRSPRAPSFAVPRMEAARSQEGVIDYAMALRLADAGWDADLAKRYLDLLHVDARTFVGGRSLEGYLDRIRAAALERAGKYIEGGYAPPESPATPETRRIETPLFVREWTLDQLSPSLDLIEYANDRAKGELAFRRAGCFTCHRVGNEGGGTGPDLTDAGGRFTPRDLLITILEPSRDISDQYRDTEIWTTDGEVFVGRVAERDAEWVSLRLPPSTPGGSDGDLVDFALEDIQLDRPSPSSRMPRGTLDGLQSVEIVEMLAWLLAPETGHPGSPGRPAAEEPTGENTGSPSEAPVTDDK